MKDFSLKCMADYSCQNQSPEKWWEVKNWGAMNSESVKVEISNQSGCYLRPKLQLRTESKIPNKLTGWTNKIMWQVSNARKQSIYWQAHLAVELQNPEWQELDYLSPNEISEYHLKIYNTEALEKADVTDAMELRFNLEWAFDFEYCPTEEEVKKEMMVIENGIIELTKGEITTTILRADGSNETKTEVRSPKQIEPPKETSIDKIAPAKTAQKNLAATAAAAAAAPQALGNDFQLLSSKIFESWWLWLIMLILLLILGIWLGRRRFLKTNKADQKDSI